MRMLRKLYETDHEERYAEREHDGHGDGTGRAEAVGAAEQCHDGNQNRGIDSA